MRLHLFVLTSLLAGCGKGESSDLAAVVAQVAVAPAPQLVGILAPFHWGMSRSEVTAACTACKGKVWVWDEAGMSVELDAGADGTLGTAMIGFRADPRPALTKLWGEPKALGKRKSLGGQDECFAWDGDTQHTHAELCVHIGADWKALEGRGDLALTRR